MSISQALKAASKRAAAAPDQAKLGVFAVSLRTMTIPIIADEKLTKTIREQLVKFADWIESESKKLA